jgi:hypothetical protein
MMSLALHCLEGDKHVAAKIIIEESTDSLKKQRSAFSLPNYPTTTLIKSNLFEVECPSEVFAFEPKVWPEEKVWKWLK